MPRKPSKDSESARAAYEKSVVKGAPLTPIELAFKFGLAPSTIYRAPWYKSSKVKS